MSRIITVLEEIVNNIRDTSNIISISYVSTSNNYYYFDIETDDLQGLSVGDWINATDSSGFDSENLEITALNSITNTITIRRKENPTITIFGTWQANKPYFMVNKLLNASNELTEKDNIAIYKNQKFPLVHVVLNILEDRDSDQVSESIANNVTIIFVNNSKHNANVEWREDNIFNPILIPLYDDFIAEMKKNKNIIKPSKLLPHTYIEDYYAGARSTENQKYDNNKNIYNEITEIIITKFNQIKLYKMSPC